jgi:hypothetical protein
MVLLSLWVHPKYSYYGRRFTGRPTISHPKARATIGLAHTVTEVSSSLTPKSVEWPAGHQKVPLQTFLSGVVPPSFAEPIYEDLLDMARRLGADPVERLTIDELTSQYRRDGKFNIPLRIEDGEITNGCHRLAALVEAGAAEVEVWVVRDGNFEASPYDGDTTEAVFRVTPGPGGYDEDVDDFDVDALWVARSMAVPGGWLESDGASSRQHDGYVNVTYEYYAPEEVVRAAVPLILARFAASDIVAELVSITPVLEP